MRRLTRPSLLGSALLIGMTLAALPAQAATSAMAPVETGAAAVVPFPPGEEPTWWPAFGDPRNDYGRSRVRSMVLTISPGHRARTKDERRVHLSCAPYRSGDHPYGYTACQQLARAGGQPSQIRSTQGFYCTREYDPVTVTARGLWDGTYIYYQSTFGNSCLLRASTGSVFRF